MYAIIEDGGRQFKVEEGLRFCIDYRDNVNPDDKIDLTNVLAIRTDEGLKIGKPALEGAKVVVKVLNVDKGPKLVVQKFRRRKDSKRRNGHRQVRRVRGDGLGEDRQPCVGQRVRFAVDLKPRHVRREVRGPAERNRDNVCTGRKPDNA